MDKNLALETLKSFVENTDNVIAKDAILAFHPELAESEDERIRKELLEEIEFIIPHDDETDSEGLILPSYHARIDRYKSYLEKQKEQKPLMSDGEIEDKKRDIVAAIRKYYPADYAAYLTSFLKGLSPEDNSEDEYGQEMLGIAYKLMYEHIPENLRTQEFWDSLKFMREYTGKVAIIHSYEHPAEWSEEDENYIEEIISNLKYAGKNRKTCSNDLAEECIHWFEANVKSLRPQPKQERSEESAIGYLKRVSSFAEPRQKEAEKRFDGQQPKTEWTIKDAKPGDILTTGTVTFIFKSVDKNGVVSMYCSYAVSTTGTNLNLSDTSTVDSKYVHPASIEQRREFLEELLGHMLSYSHWKPSEEQMEALKSYAEDSACLDNLYDDLKKL